MTTVLQLALLAGGLIGLGVALLILRLVPAQPDLTAALDNLAPERSLTRPLDTAPAPTNARDRVGLWVMRHLPVTSWGKAISSPTISAAIANHTG